MPAYLQPADYAGFGVEDATTTQVHAASLAIDGFLGRPEGLLWSADASGLPAWMTSKTAKRSCSASNVIPGANVTLAIPGARFGQGDVGSVVILDRANQPEACVINAAAGNTITLNAVQFAHTTATVEFGLTIAQEASVSRAGTVQIPASPLVGVLSLYGSRANRAHGLSIDSLLSIGTTPAVQPWTEYPVGQLDIDYQRGILSFLPGLVPAGFTRVRVNYVAGWSYATLPDAIKQATASIVRSLIDTPFSANMQSLKSGDGAMQRFGPSVLDADIKAMLHGFRPIRL